MGQTTSAYISGPRLITAIKAGDADAVMELVNGDPMLLQYSNFHQFGPCHYAARGNHVDVLQQLFAKADEVEQLMHQGTVSNCKQVHTASTKAGQRGMSSLVGQLVNAVSDRGITPLMLAVKGGCVESVKLLLEKGANPWAADKLGGRTPLHYAACKDHAEILQLLIDAAGSTGQVNYPNRPNTRYVDVRTQTGFTAVHFAVHFSNQQSLAVLLNGGANLLLSSLFNTMDIINCPQGSTALHLAAKSGNVVVAQQLLKAYMDFWHHRNLPDPRLVLDDESQLPCQVAAKRQHLAVASLLLPSSPLSSLFEGCAPSLLGPPTLAALAGAVLRSTLSSDLNQMQQQKKCEEDELQPEDEAAADNSASGSVACDTLASAAAVRANEQQGDLHAAADDVVAVHDSQQPHDVLDHRSCTCHSSKATPTEPAASGAAAAATAGATLEPATSVDAGADELCGVCLDALPQVALVPCGHELCSNCCEQLLGLNSRCVMACPFCRAGVARMRPVAAACIAALATRATAAAAGKLPGAKAALQHHTGAVVVV